MIRAWCLMFLAQAVNYGLIAAGFTYIAASNREGAFIMDIVTGLAGYAVLRQVAEARTTSLAVAYSLGGGCGTVLAMTLVGLR